MLPAGSIYVSGRGGCSAEVSVNSGTAAVPSDIAAFPFKRGEEKKEKKKKKEVLRYNTFAKAA